MLLDSARPPVIFPIVRYAVAVLSVAVALVIARLLDLYAVRAPVSLFLCAIMISGWFGEEALRQTQADLTRVSRVIAMGADRISRPRSESTAGRHT